MTLAEIRTERMRVAHEAQGLVTAARAENRGLTDAERERSTALMTALDGLETQLASAEREEAMTSRLTAITGETAERTDRAATGRNGDAESQYRAIFQDYVRFGMEGLSSQDRQALGMRHVALTDGTQNRDQTTATGAGGGFTVPQGFWAKITEVQKLYSGMLQASHALTTDTGNNMPWPTNDDTANIGVLLGENVASGTNDLVFGTRSVGAFMFTSQMVKVPFQLLQDSGVDIEGYLARKIGQRIGRILNRKLTSGTGAGEPMGILNGVTKTYTCPNSKGLKYFLNAQANSGAGWSPNNAGSTIGVDYQQLVNLVHTIDPAYRESVPVDMGGSVGGAGHPQWMMNDVTLSGMRMIQSSTGFPLWQPSIQPGIPGMILGYPYKINNDLPIAGGTLTGTTGSVAGVVLFGDFDQSYVHRVVTGGSILRLSERFADQLQVAFLGYERHDGIVDDPNAFAALTSAAS